MESLYKVASNMTYHIEKFNVKILNNLWNVKHLKIIINEEIALVNILSLF